MVHTSSRDPFLEPVCLPRFLDTYTVRARILATLPHKKWSAGTILDVGCGRMPYRPLFHGGNDRNLHYIGLDLYLISDDQPRYSPPDLYWDGRSIPVKSESVDKIMATEVLEHVPFPDRILSEIYRVLKEGGEFFLTVPFLWPLHDVPYDEYRYTPFSLERHLREAGFQINVLKPLGGWDASLAQLLGLWVRRRPMRRPVRSLLSLLLTPLIRLLNVTDRVIGNQGMITGIAVLARKEL